MDGNYWRNNMATYASIRYNFSGTGLTGVNKTANNLSDVANKSTGRTNLGVAIGSDVQAFISATAGTNANGTRTVSTSSPSGGSNGDIWYQYS
jgi:hypothetical protein|tara:strand:- start:100 stop:378 length:279 start_codon:yes stop_codon:yes gene_type:complete